MIFDVLFSGMFALRQLLIIITTTKKKIRQALVTNQKGNTLLGLTFQFSSSHVT